MTDYSDVIEKLKDWIDGPRLEHSIGVSQSAFKLAKHYGADEEKAELTGLLHDCAKELSLEKGIEIGKRYGFEPDPITRTNRALLHGPLGAYLAKDYFGIRDPDILNAIACHTTGKKNMTLLEKIICLADYIEAGRRYKGVEKVRELAFLNINKALLTGLELSIKSVMDKGRLLHPATIEARNALLQEILDEASPDKKVSMEKLQPLLVNKKRKVRHQMKHT